MKIIAVVILCSIVFSSSLIKTNVDPFLSNSEWIRESSRTSVIDKPKTKSNKVQKRNSPTPSRKQRYSRLPSFKKVTKRSRKRDLVHHMPSTIPGIKGRVRGISFNSHTLNNRSHTFGRVEKDLKPKKIRTIIKRDIIKKSRRNIPHLALGKSSVRRIKIGKRTYEYRLHHHRSTGILSVGSIYIPKKK